MLRFAPPERGSAQGAPDTCRKGGEPGSPAIGHVVFHPCPLAVLMFFGPAILLRRRYPVPCKFPSVFHTENHHVVFWHYYLFYLVKKRLLIEIIQA